MAMTGLPCERRRRRIRRAPARVHSKVVMKSRATNPRFSRDTGILAWQTVGSRAVPPAPPASQVLLSGP